jgi:hypothetical protein
MAAVNPLSVLIGAAGKSELWSDGLLCALRQRLPGSSLIRVAPPWFHPMARLSAGVRAREYDEELAQVDETLESVLRDYKMIVPH